MKKNYNILVYLMLTTIFLTTSVYSQTVDPIKFSLSTEALQVSANEEFEVIITARYISVPTSAAFVFEGANNYRINLVIPEGFKQTGGDFYNSTTGELSKSKPTITYKIKGKFTDTQTGGAFQLLRSHKNADEQSKFVQVGKLAFTSMLSDDPAEDKTARLTVVSPVGYVPYLSINKLRSGAADTAKAVYITDAGRFGFFRLDSTDTSSPDDSSTVLVYSSKRYKRITDYITPEMFGAKGDGTTDDTAPLRKALNANKSVLLSKKYKTTSTISLALSSTKNLNITGINNSEVIFTGYYRALEIKGVAGLGNFSIENVGFTGTMNSALDSENYAQAIFLDSLLNVNITRCSFKNIYGDGLRIYHGKGTINIKSNNFTNVAGLNPTMGPLGRVDDYGDGIAVVLSRQVNISENIINNSPSAHGYYGRGGIILETNGKATIVNNVVSGYSRAIHIEGTDEGSYVGYNRITKSPCSIILSQTQDNVIENNYFSNEGTTTAPAVVGDYLINGYGNNKNNIFRHNIIKVDTTAAKAFSPILPNTGIHLTGKDWLFEYNDIDCSVYMYNTTGNIFYKNKIKTSKLTHTQSNTVFKENDIDVMSFESGSTSAQFINNNIFNSKAATGVGTIIGYNSENFALVGNTITNPSSPIILNDGPSFYGEISGNKIVMQSGSTSTPWATYNPYFSRVPIFTKKKNYLIVGGIQTDLGFYYTAKYDVNGVSISYNTSAPTTGNWEVRDEIINVAPSSSQPKGWVCVASGTPGTWISY